MGQSFLIEDLVAGRSPFRAQGTRAESDFRYAAFEQLVTSAPATTARLSKPQRQRLEKLLDVQSETDCIGQQAEAAALLLELVGATPTFLVVEDAQWIDRDTRAVLRLVAPQLALHPAMLLISEPRNPGTSTLDVGQRCQLDPLDAQRARRSLATCDPRPRSPDVTALILRLGQGNPGLLQDIAGGLDDEQRMGRRPITIPCRMSQWLEDAFFDQASDLSPQALMLLATLSACSAPESADLASIIRTDFGGKPVAELECAGLIRRAGDQINYVHQAMGAAIYHRSSAGNRRAIHARLVRASPAEQPDERLYHLASSSVGPDDAVSGELLAAAVTSMSEGRVLAAGLGLLDAARFAQGRDARAKLLLEAVPAFLGCGEADLASRALSQAIELADDEQLRIKLEHLHARLRWSGGQMSESVTVLTDLVDRLARTDPALASNLAVEATMVACFGVSRAAADGLSCRLSALVDEAETLPGKEVLAAMVAIGEGISGPAARAATAAKDCPLPTGYVWTLAKGVCEIARWQFRSAARLFQVAVLRDWGPDQWAAMSTANLGLAWAELNRGQFMQATRAADEGIKAALLTQNASVEIALRLCRRRALLQLDLPHHDARLQLALVRRGVPVETAIYDTSQGELALATGDYAAAVKAFDAAIGTYRTNLEVLARPRYDLIEALIRLGDIARAHSEFAELNRRTRGLESDSHRARVSRCAALLSGRQQQRSENFAASVTYHLAAGDGFELARTRLCWGELLRRERRKAAARDQFERASQIFADCGASRWSAKVAAELQVSGTRARKRVPETLDQLTPQERRVATIVGTGATNKQAATQLHVSKKTVEQHLGNVYRKLNIRGRGELIRMYHSSALAADQPSN